MQQSAKQKKEFVDKLTADLKRSKAVYLTGAAGIDANTMTSLRKKCRDANVRYLTAKNTLAARAFRDAGLPSLDQDLKGVTSLVLAFSDATVAAKILTEFAKDNKEKVTIKGCVVEGKVCSASDVPRLATIPSREVLLSQLLSVLNAPMANLVGALSSVLRQVPAAIDAVARKKAAEA